MAGEQTFTAPVKIVTINPYVEVPARVVDSLRTGGKLAAAVRVKVSPAGAARKKPATPAKSRLARDAARLKAIARLGPGGWFRTTVVPSRSGRARLYLDTWMRESTGLTVGDRVRVRIKPDRASRELPVPSALREALAANSMANNAWEELAPSRRREILTYLNFLKSPAALESNVRKTIARLT